MERKKYKKINKNNLAQFRPKNNLAQLGPKSGK
jgi:hypothetical protein